MADAAAAAAAGPGAGSGSGAGEGSRAAIQQGLNLPLLADNVSVTERTPSLTTYGRHHGHDPQQGEACVWTQVLLRSLGSVNFWTRVLDVCVLSLLVVCMFLSPYLIITPESESTCKVFPAPDFVRVIVQLIPFPVALAVTYSSAIIREVLRATPFWASLAVLQIASIIVLASWMAVCISGAPLGLALTAGVSLLFMVIVLCGCSFNISRLRDWCTPEAEGDDEEAARPPSS